MKKKRIAESIDIFTSKECFLHCQHCMQFDELTGETIKIHSIEKAIDENFDVTRLKDVHFCGGESLIEHIAKDEWILMTHLREKYNWIKILMTSNMISDIPIDSYAFKMLLGVDTLSTSYDAYLRFYETNGFNNRIWKLWLNNCKRARKQRKWYKDNFERINLQSHPLFDEDYLYLNVFVTLSPYLYIVYDTDEKILEFANIFANELETVPRFNPMRSYANAKINNLNSNGIDNKLVEWLKKLINLKDTHRYLSDFCNSIEYRLSSKDLFTCDYSYDKCCSIDYNGDIINCQIDRSCKLYKGNPKDMKLCQQEMDKLNSKAICKLYNKKDQEKIKEVFM